MDPFRQDSNPNIVNTQQGQHNHSIQSTTLATPGNVHTHQTLPSFKEILPPRVHSAIDSTLQYPNSTDSITAGSYQISRSGGSGLPSPNYSQSSSMPDSFDDFGTRSQEPIYPYAISQRQPPSLSSNSQYSDMTAYTTPRPYQTQQLGSMGRSPGLPPIRDIDQGVGKYGDYSGNYMAPNGYSSSVYQPTMPSHPQYAGDGLIPRRSPGSFYDSKPVNAAYPTSRPYPPIKPEYATTYPPSYDPYPPRQYPDYGFSPSGMQGGGYGGSMPPHLSDGGDGRNRRRRGNLPKATTDILRSWFQKHLDHPYPSDEEKQLLIIQTGLSMNQISNWFINARRRHLPAMRQARDSRNQEEETQRQQR